MKFSLCSLITCFFLFGNITAQNLNVSYSDCDGNMQSLYNVLGSGRVVLVASKGLDCSICMSQAPANESFAAANIGRISVWGAMSKRYSASTPTCTELSNWKTTYGWNNIFMFIDAGKNFEGDGYPTYYVISPVDSSIYFTDNSFTAASQKATQLADSLGLVAASISTIETQQVNIQYTKQKLVLASNKSFDAPVVIFNLAGQIMLNETFNLSNRNETVVNIDHFNKGIYIVKAGNSLKRIAIY